MPRFTPVTHVVFDLDGLLLDTETLYTIATQNILDDYGKKFTWNIKKKMMGRTGIEAAAILIEETKLPLTSQEFHDLAEEQYKIVFPNSKFMPGAEELVEHLHKSNIPIAIASGSSMNSYKLKTQNHGKFFQMFHHVVMSSSDPEVNEGKPAPDIFRICAKRFEDAPSPEKVLVFEDAPNGVKSAVAAKMQVVMVPDPNIGHDLGVEPTLLLTSLEEFCPEEFGLPPYPNN